MYHMIRGHMAGGVMINVALEFTPPLYITDSMPPLEDRIILRIILLREE